MARPKKQVKLKEPIKIRLKPLADGNKSIYLDIYWKGVRKYEYLKRMFFQTRAKVVKFRFIVNKKRKL